MSAGYSEAEVSALTSEIPAKWERLGDLALLPKEAFLSPRWAGLGGQLWDTVAAALAVARLARQGPIANTGKSQLRLSPASYLCSDCTALEVDECQHVQKWHPILPISWC